MKLNLALNDSQREGVVEILNTLLTDEFVPGATTHKCHRNVTGRTSTTRTSSSTRNTRDWTPFRTPSAGGRRS